MIGPAEEGWPLLPTYHALRMLLQTTARGLARGRSGSRGEMTTGRSASPTSPRRRSRRTPARHGELTLVGLDTHAQYLNVASPETPIYSIGGLPPSTTFNLAIWNKTGEWRERRSPNTVKTSEAGVARFEVPLHGAFALTTVPVS